MGIDRDSWTDGGSGLVDAVIRAGATLVPGGDAVVVLFDYARDAARDRAEETVRAIAEATTLQRLTRRLSEDEMLGALFYNAVEAAARSGFLAKRRMLARVVSEAVLDDAKVDESGFIVAALRDLDSPHIAALARLAQAEEDALADGGDAHAVANAARNASRKESAVAMAALQRHAAIVAKTPTPLLVSKDTVGVEPFVVGLSDFGRVILRYLRDAEALAHPE